MPDALRITRIDIPADPDDPGRDWTDLQALARAYDLELFDDDGFDRPLRDTVVDAQTAAAAGDYRMHRLLARRGDEAVGYANFWVAREAPHLASPIVVVAPGHRRTGIGRALAERLCDEARAAGCTGIELWLYCRPAAGPQLRSPAGVGELPADDPGVRMAVATGLRLGQVVRVSRFDFGAPRIDPAAALATARAHAGDDYRVHVWEGAAPERFLDDLAELKRRMSTDAPHGEMAAVDRDWDAARLRRTESELLPTKRFWRAVAEHVPSGRLVAINELITQRARPEAFTEQWDTLVLREHRGRRLGMLVKAANLVEVRAGVPETPAVLTWNAEENAPMLRVNEELGFRPVLVEGGFHGEL